MAVPALQPQYPDPARQAETAELGMWAFLATEVLFLGGLFAAYTFYRLLHETGVEEAARHTKLVIGSVNTVVLLSSSFIMSWAVFEAEHGARRFAGRLMWIVAALGAVFLGLKGLEYSLEIGEHLWPGASFALDTPQPRVGKVFYFLYWVVTGIHALHLAVGVTAVAIVAARTGSRPYSRTDATPLRVVSLYWHFVDIVWIFVFALIYLPGRT